MSHCLCLGVSIYIICLYVYVELEFAPGSDPLVRIALVGNAMNKVLKIMEKYKENENVARFPILHSS